MKQEETKLWNKLVRCAVVAGSLPEPDIADVEGGLEWFPETLAAWFTDSTAGVEGESDHDLAELAFNIVNTSE